MKTLEEEAFRNWYRDNKCYETEELAALAGWNAAQWACAKMLGMATDLNLDLQNRSDMWRDEFARIRCIVEIGNNDENAKFLEIKGICERAVLDIRSKISLIDQREKSADEITRLRQALRSIQDGKFGIASAYAEEVLGNENSELSGGIAVRSNES